MPLFGMKTDFKLDMSRVPVWVRIILVVVIPLAVTAAVYFLHYRPKSLEIEKLLVDIGKQENEISVAETKARRLEVLKAENEWLQARLKELQQQLPEEKDVTGLLGQISNLGLQSGLDIISWKPGERRTNPSGLYDEVPVKVSVVAGYHNLGEFLASVGAMTRIVNISELKMSRGKSDTAGIENPLSVGFTATTFTAATAPPPEAGKKGKAGGQLKKEAAVETKPAAAGEKPK